MSDELVPLAPSTALIDALASAASYAGKQDAPATLRAYRSDFKDFTCWCGRPDIARRALPCEPATLAAYLASLADRRLKVSTIERRAAAVAFAHRRAGHEPPNGADSVKAVLKGIRRDLGVAKQGKAPATAKAVAAMLRRIPDDLRGKRDRALLLIGFAAALRRSELVDLKVNSFERLAEGIILRIDRSKTDQEGEGHQVAIPNGHKLRPIAALDAWLAAAGIVEGPVFRAIDQVGRVASGALSDQSVALIIKKHCGPAKLDPKLFSGHSLRAGFVTTALENGADVLKVMDVTRHRDVKTLKIYDRRAKAFKDHAGKGFL